MQTMKPLPFRTRRSAYPHFHRVVARYSDMDTEGHLNNVALASFYQDGRVAFLRGLIGNDASFRFVIASISINYLAEAHYPGEYDVGLGVSRFGTKSFDIGCGLFIGEDCVGVCDTTQVTIGERGAIPLPELLENLLRRHQILPTD